MGKNTPQEIFPGQFESLLKKWDDGSYIKAYPGKTIAVYFLKEIPDFTPDQKSVADKYIAKKSDGSYEFTAMDPAQKSQTRAAFNAISKATGLQFEFVDNPTEGAIRIGTAKTIFENGAESGGVNFSNFRKADKPLWNDIYISRGMDDQYGFGDQGYTTLLHEIGQALGLDHLSEAAGTVGVSYSRAASVMSYASWLDSEGGSAQGGNYGMTPLILDILALQNLYETGVNQGDNTNYIFDPKALSSIERLSPSANDDRHIYKGQVRALWDTSGIDTLDAQAYTERVQIDLRPGYLSSIGGTKNIAVAFNTRIENVIGGSGDDELTGNEAGNELTGGKGNDFLYGREGVDTYLFDGSFGKDTVTDTDGLGQIKINGLSLGAAPARVIPQSGNDAWMAELAGQHWLMQLRQSSSSSTGYQLSISKLLGNKAADPGNTILIDDFNVVQAMSDAGYLGIKLDSTPKLALSDQPGGNPFEQGGAFDPASVAGTATLREHGAQIFTVYLNRPAKAGETITLALSGLQDKFKAMLGDTVVSAHGAVISLVEGQTQALVGLVQEGAEVNGDGAAQLSATYQAQPLPGQTQGDKATLNLWNIDLRDAPTAYALQGGYFVPGGPQLPGGTWQIQSDGSIPGMAPLNDSNDLMVGGENEASGLYRRATGVEVDSEGKQRFTYGLTNSVSLWGLGGSDFMSGEQYDDYLDGGDGGDLIWGGAGSDTIRGGAGNDIIVTNMAATHDTYQENPLAPGYVRGPGTVFTYFGAQTNFMGRWWVEKSDDGLNLKIPRAYVKNPDGNHTYWPEGENDKDTVDAGDGDDYVWGGRGADYLMGGAGDDHLAGLGGGDVILGGEGKDRIYGDDWAAMQLSAIYDHDRDWGYLKSMPLDVALKSPVLHGDDVIDAGADDDEVWGDGGNDLIYGGSGNDRLFGDALIAALPGEYHGEDKLDGGDGNDLLIGLGKDDVLLGGAGNDELQGDYDDLAAEFHGSDALDGGEGNDMLVGGGKADVLTGGAGDDELQGDSDGLAGQFHGDDALDGGDGNDRIFGQGGSDTILGGAGNDIIEADDNIGSLAPEFHGNDVVDGGDGNDNIAGGGGNDTLYGGAGNDWIAGEDETEVDSVSTLSGDDSIFGGEGDDILVGGNGDDKIAGDEGDDWLYGGAGDDQLDGGVGRNIYKGGAGGDTYMASADGVHIIDDAEGANVVHGIEGLEPSATLEGDLVFSAPQRTVVLKGALTGSYSGSVWADGQDMAVGDYIADHVTQPLTLTGSGVDQKFWGGRGADEFFASGSNAQVRGGKGNDQITLDSTGGRVVLGRGDGRDRVLLAALPSPGAAATNRVGVQLGEGIAAGDVSFEFDAAGNVLKLRYSPEPDDVLEVAYGGLVPPSVVDAPPIGEVRLADGTVLDFNFVVQAADEDAAFVYQLPAQVFANLGAGAVLSASLAGGKPLPGWLHFDAATRTFSGTPGNDDVGNLSLQVSAVKDGTTAAFSVPVVVRNVNDAPQPGAVLRAYAGNEDEGWTIDLPEGAFTDVDRGDVLTYSAKQADGKPLPTWLQIDAKTGRLTHALGYAQATRLDVLITATDTVGASAQQMLALTVRSTLDEDAVLGTSGNDHLVGSPGPDVLIGGEGNDVLDGGGGNDVLIGGNSTGSRHFGFGSDTYLFGRADGQDTVWSGGTGTLKFKAGIRPEDVHVSRGLGSVTVWGPDKSWRNVPSGILFTIIDTGDKVMLPDFHAASGLGAGKIDSVAFTDHPGVVWNAEAISRLALIGSHGNEDISGYASNDVLRGNAGNDILQGHWGNDAYRFGKNDGKDLIFEFAGEGADKIVLDTDVAPEDVALYRVLDEPANYPNGVLVVRVKTGDTEIRVPNFFQEALGAGVESIEFANGVVWDRSHILVNAQGNASTADEFTGTAQDDRYVVDHPQDRIIEQPNGGVDSVESSITYALPVNVENLTLTGFRSINGTGNAGDNVLVGNGADNVLNGGGGGLDTMQGGQGNDTYVVAVPTERFYYFSSRYEDNEIKANITESADGGVDELRTNSFYARLPENVENLKVTSFRATSFSNSSDAPPLAKYFGNGLDNVLDLGSIEWSSLPVELEGGAGNDVLIGVPGGDTRASYRSATGAVNVSLSITGPQNTVSAGMDTFWSINGLIGSAFNDVLTGSDWQNVLDGGAGADRMVGGNGNDTYYIDNPDDVVIETAEGGYRDVAYVQGLSSYTLADHVEDLNVNLTQAASALISGNDGNNTIRVTKSHHDSPPTVVRGMGGNDTLFSTYVGMELDGGSGDDFLIGGRYTGGIFIGGTGNDTYEIVGGGSGEVIRANAVADPSEVNTLLLTGVTRANLRFQRKGDDLVIPRYSGDLLRIEKFFDAAGAPGELSPVQTIVLDDGSTLDFAAITAFVKENTAPIAHQPIAPAEARDGEWFTWGVPYDAFTDDGDMLTYSAILEDSSPLPSWATFDADSGQISGMVRANGNQDLRIRITATDEEGLSTSAIFELAVRVENLVLDGTASNDTLRGMGGDDVLSGLGGKDQLQGGAGNDRLLGGDGDDSLFGQTGNDTLLGGSGNDFLSGGSGDDVFQYTKGDGQDTLDATDVKTAVDKLVIHGWLPSQVQLLRSGNHLFVRMDSADQIALYNYFQADSVQEGVPADGKIDQIVFDNGDVWDQAKIDAVLVGGGGGGGGTGGGSTHTPPPASYTYAYVLASQYSDYTLSGNAPYVFMGNSKANKLTGNDGANVINGAAGNDTLTGGKGGDTYFLEAGTGQDTIVENDITSGVTDLLQWGSDIQHNQLWLRKIGNNLEISVIGKTDRATVKDWYLGDSHHVEQIWADGKVLLDTKVQSLVDAMAAFAPPPAGQTTLPAHYQSALSPVLAANWQ